MGQRKTSFAQVEMEFCDVLDDLGQVKIGDLFYTRSELLKRIDPIAYHQGVLNLADSMDVDLVDEDELD